MQTKTRKILWNLLSFFLCLGSSTEEDSLNQFEDKRKLIFSNKVNLMKLDVTLLRDVMEFMNEEQDDKVVFIILIIFRRKPLSLLSE